MNILIVCQYFYPENFRINDIAAEWIERGHNVSVVTGIPNYPEGRFYKGYSYRKNREEVYKGINIHRLFLIPRGKNKVGIVLNYLSFMLSGLIWAHTTRTKADVIFSFETSPMTQLLIGTRYARRKHIRHIVYIQDLWPENVEVVGGIHNPLIIRPLDSMVKYIYRNADLVLATSPSFVDLIIDRMNTDKKKSENDLSEKVIYWPQYAEEFYKPVAKPGNSVSDNICKIVFTGNIGYAQGLEILPGCAACLDKLGYRDKVKFILVGDGRARKDLQKLIQDSKVTDMFEFRGRKKPEEIPGILAECDLAFLSFSENKIFSATIPAKLQSYMACAMPILAVATGETKRIIDTAECGFCSKTGDEKALADSIEGFMNLLPEEIRKMSVNSLNYYREHFDRKMLMDKMEEYLIG